MSQDSGKLYRAPSSVACFLGFPGSGFLSPHLKNKLCQNKHNRIYHFNHFLSVEFSDDMYIHFVGPYHFLSLLYSVVPSRQDYSPLLQHAMCLDLSEPLYLLSLFLLGLSVNFLGSSIKSISEVLLYLSLKWFLVTWLLLHLLSLCSSWLLLLFVQHEVQESHWYF